jgi:hypothetical protein
LSHDNETAVHITCPIGNVIRNALNLITDARKQLPENFRGLIALKIFDGLKILKHIVERIRQREYENIAAIIIIDNNNLFSIKNELHTDVTDEVLNVPSSLTI